MDILQISLSRQPFILWNLICLCYECVHFIYVAFEFHKNLYQDFFSCLLVAGTNKQHLQFKGGAVYCGSCYRSSSPCVMGGMAEGLALRKAAHFMAALKQTAKGRAGKGGAPFLLTRPLSLLSRPDPTS